MSTPIGICYREVLQLKVLDKFHVIRILWQLVVIKALISGVGNAEKTRV